MKMFVVFDDKKFTNPIKYTFDLILNFLGVEFEIFPYSEFPANFDLSQSLLLSYGNKRLEVKAYSHIHIYQSNLFSNIYNTPESMPKLPLKRWKDLPVIYLGNGDLRDLVMKNGNLIETNIDIIASSFFMLSRYEEILVEARDLHDRFPASESIAYKEGFLTRPIVNEYMELLWEWINGLNMGFKRKKLWDGKDFAVCLTHDVDKVKSSEIKNIGSCLKQGKLKKAISRTFYSLPIFLGIKPDSLWSFDYIIETERKYGLTSSFYFMAGGKAEFDITNNYSIDEIKITNLIKKLNNRGHEVGFHGSFDTYNNYNLFESEKGKLDKVVPNKQYGGRQHYLRWKTPYTWRIYEKAGMLYDATLSYADHEGFRCGICLPYKPYDVLEDRVLDVWELPLTAMEDTICRYRGLSPEEAWESFKELINIISKHHGVFVLLWHNSFLDEFDLREWRELYEKLMEYIGSKNVFCQNGRSIVNKQV